MTYVRKIQRNGASIIRPSHQSGPPWVKHGDPGLRAWMAERGYDRIEDIPPEEDYRGCDQCDRCGELGVEGHHTAPKEWFGATLSETYPIVDLCRQCHELWHAVARIGAAKQWAKQARMRGLTAVADGIEKGLEREVVRVRQLAAADSRRRDNLAGRDPAA